MMTSLRLPTCSLLLVAALVMGCGGSTPESFVASAKEYLRKNDTPAAVIQLKNALQKNPDLPEARFLLGMALLDTGDVRAAEKELRKAYELKYPADQVVPPLARVTVKLGQYKKAIDEFGATEITNPERKAELQTAIGQAQLALGNVAAAEAAFGAALTSAPKYAPAQLGRATLAAAKQQWKEALELTDSAIATAPKLAEAWQLKAGILAAQGQPDAAIDAYRKAIEAQPDSLVAHWGTVSILFRQNKIDDAVKALDAMKKVAPKHPQTLYLQALLAYRTQKFDVARDAIQQQLKVAPEFLPGILLAGAIDYQLKEYAQAEAHLLKVLQRVPEQRLALRMLIANYIRSGQPGKAFEALKPLLTKIDKDPDMLAVAGEVYMVNGRVNEAADYFAKSAALDRVDVRKRTALALSHMAQGSTTGFVELEEAAAADVGVRADLALISARMQRGEHDKALAAIDALEKKQPESPVPHNLRGGVLLAKNDRAGARHSFEKALEKDASYFPAIVSLGRLDVADKKFDVARQRFESVLVKNPKHVESLLALAELRAASGGKA